MCCAYRQEVVNLADAAGQVWWRDDPSHAPAGDRERFARAADCDRAVGHAIERRQAHMATAINEVLVYLVGDRNGVVLDA